MFNFLIYRKCIILHKLEFKVLIYSLHFQKIFELSDNLIVSISPEDIQ